MNTYTINENTLQNLQSFTTIEEMNEAVKTHKQAHNLNQRNRTILDTISRYACKYTGVCYLSKQKIAEDAEFASRRTAIRACNQLEKLGIIKQYETKRITGDKRQSTNIIVIQPSELEPEKTTNPNTDKPQSHGTDTPACHPKEAPAKTPYKTKTYKDTAKADTEGMMKKSLKNSIPAPFYKAFEPFLSAKELYKTYGTLLRAKAAVGAPFLLETFADRYIVDFYKAIRKFKWGQVKNINNYLYVTWENLTAVICRQMKWEEISQHS